MDYVKQDFFAVLSLLEHTLVTIKQHMPNITEAYLRSDNAGCYHCGQIWLSIPSLSERTGILVFVLISAQYTITCILYNESILHSCCFGIAFWMLFIFKK